MLKPWRAGDVKFLPTPLSRETSSSSAIWRLVKTASSSKASKRATIGEGTHVGDALVAEQDLYVARGCAVKGPGLEECDIFVDTGARIGTMDAPTTVTGSSIYVASGARWFGLATRMEA